MPRLAGWKPFRIIRLFILVGVVCISLATVVQAATPIVDVLTVKGTINPVLVDYIKRGIDKAESDRATACIIQIDTPGGLDISMRDIVQTIVNARVPIVVYVSPSGARAASAGVFITMAAHVAAMAPNTNIGAAHPVSIGTTGDTSSSSTMDEKIINDAAAYIKSIAQAHGRNVTWAEQAVRESVSATEQEALSLNVIDMVAPDLNTLLSQLDGRTVTMLDGNTVTLHTQGVAVTFIKMNWVEDFLYAIADPNIAYLLMGLAVLGIFAEIFNPGLIFPGIIGGICGLLAFYALGMLPVNLTGILLLVLAIGLFIAEAFTPGFGLLAGGGIASLVIGSLILFKGGVPGMRVNPGLIAVVTILIAGFFIFVVQRVVKVHRKQATTGREELLGKTVITRTALTPEGQVFFRGERWEAVSESGNIEANETVTISKVEGLTLHVKKLENKEGGKTTKTS
jgi:membrane-bound serine protease (ClpP class)